jgi:hypothetical protein
MTGGACTSFRLVRPQYDGCPARDGHKKLEARVRAGLANCSAGRRKGRVERGGGREASEMMLMNVILTAAVEVRSAAPGLRGTGYGSEFGIASCCYRRVGPT